MLFELAASAFVLPELRPSHAAAVASYEIEDAVAGFGSERSVHRDHLRLADCVGVLVVSGGSLAPFPVEHGVGDEPTSNARAPRKRDDHLAVRPNQMFLPGPNTDADVHERDLRPRSPRVKSPSIRRSFDPERPDPGVVQSRLT